MRKKIKHAEIVQRFARRMRELRQARGMTQRELASASQIHFTYVGKLERGEVAPGLDILDRIAQALGASAATLVGGDNIDPVPLIRERARDRFESLLKRGDASALSLATTLLTLIEQSLRK